MPDSLYLAGNFRLEEYRTRLAWLEARKHGIGGSEAAAFLGYGWNTLRDLWRQKHDIRAEDDASRDPALVYGTEAEEPLRKLYTLKHPEQSVQYRPFCNLISKTWPWMRYSPDGLISDPKEGKGILEIKTQQYRNKDQYESDWGTDWKPETHRMPMAYYCQVLHGLLVTGFDFVVLSAEIRFRDGTSKIIERKLYRSDVEVDMEVLRQAEEERYQSVVYGMDEPPITFWL